MMQALVEGMLRWRVRQDCRAQDMVEYALLAGFVALAAGVFSPGMSQSISQIYSKLASKLVEAGG